MLATTGLLLERIDGMLINEHSMQQLTEYMVHNEFLNVLGDLSRETITMFLLVNYKSWSCDHDFLWRSRNVVTVSQNSSAKVHYKPTCWRPRTTY